MAKITYSALLGPYGEIGSFYDEALPQLQGQKSSPTQVIYKGEDQNKFVITGSGLQWEGDFLTEGNITGITFTTKEGDPYLSIKGGQHTVAEFNDAFANHGGIAGVEALLLAGKDTVTGSKISDKIESGAGADLVHGGAADDSLDGGAGNDRLFGDAGNDYIFGGLDKDRMAGGGGSDSFHFSSGNGQDIVTDFDAKGGGNKQDYLSLFQDDPFTIHRAGNNNTLLDFGDGETLTLLGVKRGDFSIADDVHWIA